MRVNPNRLDDYLEGLRQTLWTSCEVQKKQGTVLECSIFASESMSNRDFNLMLAQDKEKKLVEGYDTLRTFFGEPAFRKLTFK